MQRTNYHHVILLVTAPLLLVAVAGCNKTTGSTTGGTVGGSPAPTASSLDARIQSVADKQTRGREADALKQAEAMKKLNQK